MKRMIFLRSKIITSALLVLFAIGCGGEEKPTGQLKAYPVFGKVNFEGKSLKNAEIKLFNMEKDDMAKNQVLPRPKGRVKEDGTFFISTYKAGDGAPIGEYALTISWKGDLKGFDEEEDDLDDLPELLPYKYTVPMQTTVRVIVTEGENEVPEINIKS